MKRFNVIKYLLILSLFIATGCDEITTDQTFTIGKESTFRINELYYSTDRQYAFQINEISDSRCPEGLMCIWSGEISLKGEWSHNGTKTAVELHTVMKDLQKEPEGFKITITDAIPYPKYGSDSKPENLVVTLLIQKK